MTIAIIIAGLCVIIFIAGALSEYAKRNKDARIIVKGKSVLKVVAWLWIMVVIFDIAGTVLDKLGERQLCEWVVMAAPGILAVFISKP